MTPKQILDSFSDTLMQDERILSVQERALLAALLQHARAAGGESQETQEAVRTVFAAAIGETVGQRAFAVLGGSIVERILESGSLSATNPVGVMKTEPQPPRGTPLRTPGVTPPPGHQPQSPGVRKPSDPQTPSHQPQPPGVRTPSGPQSPGHQPQSPGRPMRDTPAPQPQPPRGSIERPIVAEDTVAVAERPSRLPACCVVFDEFLAPQELDELTCFALAHEPDFSASEVISPIADGGVVNYEHRRSRVLMDLERHQDVILGRIKSVLPEVLEKLEMGEFSIAEVEAQITASSDGDFFHFHSDNGSDKVASRHLTFVYFFQREPNPFSGGELRIHDARLEGDSYVSEGSYQTIVPRQNQIVFFPCDLMHEITPVQCASPLFADSRFTLNGWLRR
jgi:Rps23 Pro-64 3,4-dihydroxylase Tpa1-like proline 4-hydroxylase